MPGLSRSILQEIRVTRWPVVEEASFARGIVRDMPRSAIPAGGVYDATDFLFDRPGVVYKRGGFAYQGSAYGDTYGNMVFAAPFAAGEKIYAVGTSSGVAHLYDVTSTSSDLGALTTVVTGAVFFNDYLLMAENTSAPQKVNSAGTISAIGGSPPSGSVIAVHLERVLVAHTVANPNRIYFSPVPSFETTWDTTNAYIDMPAPVVALASIQGVLVVFTADQTLRIIGDTPPGTTGENMQVQPVAKTGCMGSRSVARTGTDIIFASKNGVYTTNGAGVTPLMTKPDGYGITSYWRAQVATLIAANGGLTDLNVAGGMLGQDYYIVNLIYNPVSAAYIGLGCFACYLPTGAWTTLNRGPATPFNGKWFSTSQVNLGELYVAAGDTNRVWKMSSILTPSATYKNDADGTAVAPTLEPRMIGNGTGLKSYGHAHITYDMRDAASDTPTLAVTCAPGIEATTYAAVQDGTPLAATTDATRKRFTVNKDSQAMNYKFVQTNASSKTEIYAVETEVRPFAEQADGQ